MDEMQPFNSLRRTLFRQKEEMSEPRLNQAADLSDTHFCETTEYGAVGA